MQIKEITEYNSFKDILNKINEIIEKVNDNEDSICQLGAEVIINEKKRS